MSIHVVGEELAVSVAADDDLILAALYGPLDVYTVPGLRDRLVEHVGGSGQVVIDLSEVTLLDSAGLGMLISIRNRGLRETGQGLGLICPQRRLRHIFEIAGLRRAFSFGPDLGAVRDALASAVDN